MRCIVLAMILLALVLAQAARAEVPAEAARWHDPPWRAAVESQHSGLNLRFEMSETPQGFALILEVANPGETTLRFSCPTHEVFDFTVLRFGQPLWHYNHNRFFVQTPLEVRIAPGETIEYRGDWDGISNHGVPLKVWLRVDAEALLKFEGTPVRLRICNVTPRARMTFVNEPGANLVSARRTAHQEEAEDYSAYADVPTDHWAYRAIESFRELGVLAGYPEGFFSGERTFTRQKLALPIRRIFDLMSEQEYDARTDALLWALEGEFYDQLLQVGHPVLWSGEPPDYHRERPKGPEDYDGVPGSAYEDVPTGHWAYRAIESFRELGGLEGYPEGFFNGKQVRVRYEFAQALCRLFSEMRERRTDARTIALLWALDAEFYDQLNDGGSWRMWSVDLSDYHLAGVVAPGGYEEVPADHWAYNAVDSLREGGALDRYSADYFGGEPTLDRTEFALVIQHLFDWFRRHGWDNEIDELLTALEVEFYDQLSVDCEVALWTESAPDDAQADS